MTLEHLRNGRLQVWLNAKLARRMLEVSLEETPKARSCRSHKVMLKNLDIECNGQPLYDFRAEV